MLHIAQIVLNYRCKESIDNTWVGERKVVVVRNMINYCGSDQTKERVL